MSDQEIRDLAREVRGGDESARQRLTAVCIRARQGFLIAWLDEQAGTHKKRAVPPPGTVWVEVRREERYKRERVFLVHALAVLDLDDLMRLALERKHGNFEVMDLATGRALSGAYAREAVALEFRGRADPPRQLKKRYQPRRCAGNHRWSSLEPVYAVKRYHPYCSESCQEIGRAEFRRDRQNRRAVRHGR